MGDSIFKKSQKRTVLGKGSLSGNTDELKMLLSFIMDGLQVGQENKRIEMAKNSCDQVNITLFITERGNLMF